MLFIWINKIGNSCPEGLGVSDSGFWLKSVAFKADISVDKYFTLFPIKEGADKILAKALELNTEKHVIGEWGQLAVLVNNLIEGLKK